MTKETMDQRFINIGQKVQFTWSKPYGGVTPGEVVGFKRGNIVINWLDGTVTTTSKEWYFKFVQELK